MTWIGLGHIAQVGKSSIASILVDQYGFTEISFAAPLKSLAYVTDPLIFHSPNLNTNVGRGRLKNVVQMEGWENAKRKYPEVRVFLQNLGSAAREVFDENFWLDAALSKAVQHENVVFSDVRYKNEHAAVKDFAAFGDRGFTVRVDRPGYMPANLHPSETELLNAEWDYVLNNNALLSHLPGKVAQMLDALGVQGRAP